MTPRSAQISGTGESLLPSDGLVLACVLYHTNDTISVKYVPFVERQRWPYQILFFSKDQYVSAYYTA
jgi:hypothetical protein